MVTDTLNSLAVAFPSPMLVPVKLYVMFSLGLAILSYVLFMLMSKNMCP